MLTGGSCSGHLRALETHTMTNKILLRSLLAAASLALFPFATTNLRAAPGDIFETNEGNLLRFRVGIAGGPTTFTVGFSNPKGLVFDGNGHLYVADAGKNAILVFTIPDGSGSTYLSGLNAPTGVALDQDGNLYVSEAGSGNILKFTPDRTKTTFASNVGASAGLVFDNSGNLFSADFNGGKIYKFTPDGTRTTFASGLNHPAGLAFDSGGNLYEADSESSTIFKFAPDGTKSTFVTGVGRPFGVAVETNDSVIVADNENGGTFRFTPEGTKSVIFSSDFNTPAFVAVEPVQHKLLNMSARGLVQANDPLIAGFVVGGNGPVGTSILVRALGPSLSGFGVVTPLADPTLELHDASGALIASNNDWRDTQAGAITATGLPPTDDKEAAILVTLHGGAFTAVVGSASGTMGTAVVEVYNIQ
jgi:sugar lactone lactonase YvrE